MPKVDPRLRTPSPFTNRVLGKKAAVKAGIFTDFLYPIASDHTGHVNAFDSLDSWAWDSKVRKVKPRRRMVGTRLIDFNTLHHQRIFSIRGAHSLVKALAPRFNNIYYHPKKPVTILDTSRLSRRILSSAPLTSLSDIADFSRNFINTSFDPKLGSDANQANLGSVYVIKQKRVKSPAIVKTGTLSNDMDFVRMSKIRLAAGQMLYHHQKALQAYGADSVTLQKLIAHSRVQHDLINIDLAQRLLRTNLLLVLPAQANLTIITNSYDVVHS